jgi:hypothetical protein
MLYLLYDFKRKQITNKKSFYISIDYFIDAYYVFDSFLLQHIMIILWFSI